MLKHSQIIFFFCSHERETNQIQFTLMEKSQTRVNLNRSIFGTVQTWTNGWRSGVVLCMKSTGNFCLNRKWLVCIINDIDYYQLCTNICLNIFVCFPFKHAASSLLCIHVDLVSPWGLLIDTCNIIWNWIRCHVRTVQIAHQINFFISYHKICIYIHVTDIKWIFFFKQEEHLLGWMKSS